MIPTDKLDIKKILQNGENEHFEFKKATNNFPKEAFSTISAFANSSGGLLILGVSQENDSFYPSGISNKQKIIDDLFNSLNNQQKINKNLISPCDINSIFYPDNNTELLLINVRAATFKEKPIYLNGNSKNTYIRQGSGDYKCSEQQINAMIRDAAEESYDSKILDGYELSDLDSVSISMYLDLIKKNNPEHPFLLLPKKDFLVKIGAMKKNRKNGNLNCTLAGLLMFGFHSSIKKYLPHYHIEYINKENFLINGTFKDRIIYDGTWGEDNLLTFFFIVQEKLFLTLKDSSVILDDGTTRAGISKLKIAIREAFVNSIIHNDFLNKIGIQITRYPHYIEFYNGGSLRISKYEFFTGGHSEPRNHYIQEMFRLINICERAGSGIPKILDATTTYKLRSPELDSSFDFVKFKLWDTTIVDSDIVDNPIEKEILSYILSENFVTRKEIDSHLSIHKNTTLKYLKALEDKGLISKSKISGNKYHYYLKESPNMTNYSIKNTIYTLLNKM